MKLYRFSPISDEQTIQDALEHIQKGMRELSTLCLEESLPIYTLKLFAHYPDEYDYLFEWINTQGAKDAATSNTSYYVRPTKPLTINGEAIEYLGLRVPDPYRAHVGCGDFVVTNFNEFKHKYLGSSPFIREVTHPTYEMLELFNPDSDVLGYIVNKVEK